MPIFDTHHVRRLCLRLVLAVLLLAGCAGRPASGLLPTKGGKAGKDLVVFLGDSLTAGYGVAPQYAYPSVIGEYWQSNHIALRALNAGISGDTTTGVLARLDALLTPDVCLVYLEIGANDLFSGEDVDGIHTRISEIIRRIQGKGLPVALASLDIDPNTRSVGAQRAALYRSMYQELSKEHKVPVMPYFTNVGGKRDLWLSDGLHLTEQGNRIIARDVLAFLNPEWKLEL
jgi:acyl-CoA thioesterase I